MEEQRGEGALHAAPDATTIHEYHDDYDEQKKYASSSCNSSYANKWQYRGQKRGGM